MREMAQILPGAQPLWIKISASSSECLQVCLSWVVLGRSWTGPGGAGKSRLPVLVGSLLLLRKARSSRGSKTEVRAMTSFDEIAFFGPCPALSGNDIWFVAFGSLPHSAGNPKNTFAEWGLL